MSAKNNQEKHEAFNTKCTGNFKETVTNSKTAEKNICKFFYSNEKLAFDGQNDSNGLPIKGSWYHTNGQQFYSGPFSNGRPGDSEANQAKKNIYKVFNDNQEILYSGTLFEGKGDSEEEYIDLLLPIFDYNQIITCSDDKKQIQLNPHSNGVCHTKIYGESDNLEYQGCYIDGFRTGHGKCFFEENKNLRFEGIFKNDLPVEGILYHENGVKRCEGKFKNGQMDGAGITVWYDSGVLKYEGSMKSGASHGPGSWYFENGNMKFEGNFQDDMPHGNDVKIYTGEGSLEYKGSLNKGQRQGWGVLYYFNNNKSQCYEGNWFNNEMHGENSTNKLYHQNGILMYQGAFKNGKRHGQGKLYYDNGFLTCEGRFHEGELEGDNIVYYHNFGGLKFQGNVVDTKDNGWCRRYNSNGKLAVRGFFDKGNAIGDNFTKCDENPEVTENNEPTKVYQLGTYLTEYYENGSIKRICDKFYNKEGKITSFEELNKILAIEEAEKKKKDVMTMFGKKDNKEEIPKDQLMNLLGGNEVDEEEDDSNDDNIDEEKLQNEINEEEISEENDEEISEEEDDDESFEDLEEEGESNDDEQEITEKNNEEIIEENSQDEEEDEADEYTEEQLNAAEKIPYKDKLTCLISMQAMGFDVSEELKKIEEQKLKQNVTEEESILKPINIVNKSPVKNTQTKPKEGGLFSDVNKVENQVKSSGLFGSVKETKAEAKSGLFSDVGKVENQNKGPGLFSMVNNAPSQNVKSNGLFSNVKK